MTWRSPANTNNWPNGYTTATTFCSVFNQAPCTVYSGKTLLDVINTNGSTPPDDVGRYVIAAMFNALAGFTPLTILSIQQIQDIWTQFETTGFYSPRANVTWDHTSIVTYLQSTMPI